MRVIIKRPEDAVGSVQDIPNTLEALQEAVDGPIETITVCTDLVIICNDEGRLRGLPYNCSLLGAGFFGTVVVVGKDGDEFADCPLAFHDWVLRWLK